MLYAQLVLPGMRQARRGRILNVSSMGGRTTLPGGAFYHASKHALEALSDALRMEVKQFAIDVVLIEPGPVKTPWNDVAAASVTAAESADDADPYTEYKAAVTASFATATTGHLARLASSPEDIAAVIARAVTTRRPRTRYLINPDREGQRRYEGGAAGPRSRCGPPPAVRPAALRARRHRWRVRGRAVTPGWRVSTSVHRAHR